MVFPPRPLVEWADIANSVAVALFEKCVNPVAVKTK